MSWQDATEMRLSWWFNTHSSGSFISLMMSCTERSDGRKSVQSSIVQLRCLTIFCWHSSKLALNHRGQIYIYIYLFIQARGLGAVLTGLILFGPCLSMPLVVCQCIRLQWPGVQNYPSSDQVCSPPLPPLPPPPPWMMHSPLLDTLLQIAILLLLILLSYS